MEIRPFRPEDAEHLPGLMHAAIHTLAARAYSPAQLAAWSPAPMPADTFLARARDGRDIFVATDDKGQPLGFIELEPSGHVDCFYCAPDAAGQGIGAALYAALERAAIARALPELHVDASEIARGFFLRRGFCQIARNTIRRHGTILHNYTMTKTL